jgi:hypothetical protein
MPLRHALLQIGIPDAELDERERDPIAREAHRYGVLELARSVTAAISREALAGNISAAKLLLQRRAEGDDDVAQVKLSAFAASARSAASEIDVLPSVEEAFARMRALHEAEGWSENA